MTDEQPPQQGADYQKFYSWQKRRRYMCAVTIFCMGVIAYVLGWDKTGPAAETAVMFAFLALIGITGSYVFGAVWQDVSHMASLSRNSSYNFAGQYPAGPVRPGE